MDYITSADSDALARTVTALTERNFQPVLVQTKEEALAKIQELIPAGASVNNGGSRTLEQVGFVNLLKSGEHAWQNLHTPILKEEDPATQGLLRKQHTVSDYYLGSVHALTETGELVIVSATGSQLPAIAYNAQNLILVVGAQKVVPTLTDAFERIRNHVLPLQEETMRQKHGIGTVLAKTLVLHHEYPMMGRKVYVVIVNESLGF